MDEFLRELERLAATGDQEALEKLAHHRARLGQATYSLPMMYRRYRCLGCGGLKNISTNHTGNCFDRCADCSWKGMKIEDRWYHPGLRPFNYVGPAEWARWARNPSWHASSIRGLIRRDGKTVIDPRPGRGCWRLNFSLLNNGWIVEGRGNYSAKTLAQITVTCPSDDKVGHVETNNDSYGEPIPWTQPFYDLISGVVEHIPEVGDFTFRSYETVNEYLDNVPNGIPLFWYHGTSSSRLPHIQKFGLRPRAQTGSDPVWAGAGKHLPSQPGLVYLTANKNLAKFAAEHACDIKGAGLGGDPVILSVEIPDPSLLAVDEDALRTSTVDYDEESDVLSFLDEEELYSRYRATEEWLKYSWKDSLKEIGNVGYRGRIPASFITIVD